MSDPREAGPRRRTRAVPIPRDVVGRVRDAVGSRVRVLSGTKAADGSWLLGTRDELVVLPVMGAPWVRRWEQVEFADWDLDAQRLRVRELAAYGETPREHVFTVADPGHLLELVRERVTASVVLQRFTRFSGKAGITVVARRPPGGGELRWMFLFDAGLDPADPEVREAARAALAEAAAEVGVDPARI